MISAFEIYFFSGTVDLDGAGGNVNVICVLHSLPQEDWTPDSFSIRHVLLFFDLATSAIDGLIKFHFDTAHLSLRETEIVYL